MEQDSPSTPEERTAAIAGLFGDELKKISDKLKVAKSLDLGVDTNGAVKRRQQEILHLRERQRELIHDRNFVLDALAQTPQGSEIPNLRYFFMGKLDEADLETKRVGSHSSSVIFDGGPVRGKEQELHHLRTIRSDMLRVGNFVLGVLGQPPLVDKKNPQHKT